ncbi:MAG: L-threonylcarbamoyladenylate synthase [Nocardioides sp.]|uniref:L-threonylcarbamoyladenylate synthase n=1 Tax=Nocardioides nematodiphilus TaxID=2849669 RepID=UPI001CDA4570|nr:L-threonylcarbamoyladenylate synthase [Nocardioides nematodiphilus]MCA1982358.1 threonylcarbamoyl-AMP synthase [Nocardioides nematodiphilus]
MSKRFTTGTDEEREAAVSAAVQALRAGEVAVIPTDTVYGIAADAFDAAAVRKLLAAKGRGREMPPPVLVAAPSTVDALAIDIPDWARALFVEFWPGPLTVVLHQQSSLQWDLGETRGTVAVRVPDHAVALEILGRTGPLAVSSANKTGRAAALDADAAEEMLGEDVIVIVDDGTVPGGEASTILDATAAEPRLLRLGALSVERIDAVLAAHGVSVQGVV